MLSHFFLYGANGVGPSALHLAATLSNIVAVERNHFLFHELIAIGRTARSAVVSAARFDARAALFCAADQVRFVSPPVEGMAMNAGPFHIQSMRLADIGGSFPVRPAQTANFLSTKLVWLPVAAIVGLGAWMLVSGYAGDNANSHPEAKVNFATAASIQPSRLSEPNPALDASQFNPAAAPAEGTPVDGLKISSQSWRRGGLGSKALITFTLRNDNDYAVGDIGILCSFSRKDGSPVTERRQTIRDTVKMKSRKTFARIHVGFINITANQAKCSLLSASRV
jgi:hypothetical protein